MSVDELKLAVSQLPGEEFDHFWRWFEEFLADEWDRRIEADIAADRIDAACRLADEEFEAGRCAPLPPLPTSPGPDSQKTSGAVSEKPFRKTDSHS
jgi:hypothetical protein